MFDKQLHDQYEFAKKNGPKRTNSLMMCLLDQVVKLYGEIRCLSLLGLKGLGLGQTAFNIIHETLMNDVEQGRQTNST